MFKVTQGSARRIHRAALETLERRTLLSSVIVNTTTDGPHGLGFTSLRDAIAIANSSASPTTITFDPSVFASAQTIVLTGGTLNFTNASEPTTLIGPAAALSVSGNDAAQAFNIENGIVNLSNFSIIDGNNQFGGGFGGGVGNNANLTLTNMTISGNTGLDGGGGLANFGTATLIDVSIINNIAGDAGGISNYGNLTVNDSTISGNYGANAGGISNYGDDSVTMMDSTISGNTGDGVDNLGTLNLTGVTIAGNIVPRGRESIVGIVNADGGVATLINVTIANNPGVGILNGVDETIPEENPATMTISDSTISGNSYEGEGGIVNYTNLSMGNTIVAGNSSYEDGGHIDVSGSIHSLGHNLIGEIGYSTGWLSSDLTGTRSQPVFARLGALANNGGLTMTLVPFFGSPAIDAGSNALIPSGITTDQRGLPRIVNGTVDIGAAEVQSTIVVNTTRDLIVGPIDPGLMTLREALGIANSLGSNMTTITFDPTVFAMQETILLDGGDLKVKGNCAITGPAAGVTISASDAGNVMVIDADATATLSNLTIAGGYLNFSTPATLAVDDVAAGLTVRGSATLSDVTISGNSIGADPGAATNQYSPAAGLVNHGTLTMTGSTISGNNAISAAGGFKNEGTATLSSVTISHNYAELDGGGVTNLGTITISNSTIANNSAEGDGGGLDNKGAATLTNVTFSANYAGFYGGGIRNSGTLNLSSLTMQFNTGSDSDGALFNAVGGVATVAHVMFTDNGAEATGAVGNFGTISLRDVTFTKNSSEYAGALDNAGAATLLHVLFSQNASQGLLGGGMQNESDGTGTLTDVTFSANTAYIGGGLANAGALTLINVTIAGNSAGIGGGIFNGPDGNGDHGSPQLKLYDCTISGNSAVGPSVNQNYPGKCGGIYIASGGLGGTVTIANTIVAGNSAAMSASDVFGNFDSLGNNLIGKTNHSTGWVETDLTGTTGDPLDAMLGPLEGSAQTMQPLTGSPAIAAGSVALVPSGVTTDQRGFPRILDDSVDIGAVEIN